MKHALIFITLSLLVLGSCSENVKRKSPEDAEAKNSANSSISGSSSDLVGVVAFTRNFKPSLVEANDSYAKIPKVKRLGSKAYRRVNPLWWEIFYNKYCTKYNDEEKDFPLCYWGEVDYSDRKYFVVLQLVSRFTGDGYYKPGPETHCVVRVFKHDNGSYEEVSSKSSSLGSTQYSCIYFGFRKDRSIELICERGNNFASEKPNYSRTIVVEINRDGSSIVKIGDLTNKTQ